MEKIEVEFKNFERFNLDLTLVFKFLAVFVNSFTDNKKQQICFDAIRKQKRADSKVGSKVDWKQHP